MKPMLPDSPLAFHRLISRTFPDASAADNRGEDGVILRVRRRMQAAPADVNEPAPAPVFLDFGTVFVASTVFAVTAVLDSHRPYAAIDPQSAISHVVDLRTRVSGVVSGVQRTFDGLDGVFAGLGMHGVTNPFALLRGMQAFVTTGRTPPAWSLAVGSKATALMRTRRCDGTAERLAYGTVPISSVVAQMFPEQHAHGLRFPRIRTSPFPNMLAA